MILRRLALPLTLLLLAAPGPAAAQTTPPGAPYMAPSEARAALSGPVAQSAAARGQTRGVRARRGRGGVVVGFSGPARRLFRRAVAGRRVRVACTRFEGELLGVSVTNKVSTTLRAPRNRPTLRTDLRGRFAYCEVLRPAFIRRPGTNRRIRLPSTTLATDAITERGTAFLDERERAGLLSAIVGLAAFNVADLRARDTYPESGPFVKKVGGPLVVLDDPLASPPKGKVGYFSDGKRHIAVATLSEQGRRLFIDFNEDVIATNVLEYLVDD